MINVALATLENIWVVTKPPCHNDVVFSSIVTKLNFSFIPEAHDGVRKNNEETKKKDQTNSLLE